MKAIDLLPPIKSSGKGLGAAIRAAAKRGAANDKPKVQASIPKIKQVHKLVTALGQTVTEVRFYGDGGFSVSTATPGISDTSGPSEWD